MRNALTNLAETGKDPEQKKVGCTGTSYLEASDADNVPRGSRVKWTTSSSCSVGT